MTTRPRLNRGTLASLPADVARPPVARDRLRAGIVHLGIGAFQRAHLAAVNEAALGRDGDPAWGTVGVSLRSPDTRDALAPQDGLYTLALRDAAADGTPRESLRVIGHLLEVLYAPEDPGAVLDRIAHRDTRIVALTITEKGYHHDPATGALRLGDDAIRHDLAHPEAPCTMPGFVVHALARRRARGLGALAVMSCDNLPANGDTTRGIVLTFARAFDAGLHDWIAEHCTFPNAMVDRIVPRTTDADRERIARRLGVDDAWPVVAEPFLEWVVEDRFAAGRPDWTAGGARFVEHAEPYERLKLRMVNGAHSALAYLGSMAGFETVDRAIAQPALHSFVDALLRDEIAPTLPPLPGLDLDAYRARLLARFANPALQHRTRQIAMDGSQKVPQRWLGTVRDRLAAGAPIDRLGLAVAAWMHHLRGVDETGATYGIQDPLADELAERIAVGRATATIEERVAGLLGYTPVFGTLGAEPRLVTVVCEGLRSLERHGVVATLERAGSIRSRPAP